MFKEGPQLKGCVTPILEAIHTSPGHVPELLLSLGLQKARWRLQRCLPTYLTRCDAGGHDLVVESVGKMVGLNDLRGFFQP